MRDADTSSGFVPLEVLLEGAARERDAYRELLLLALAQLHDAECLAARRKAEVLELRNRLAQAMRSAARVA
jgi:hypothetical protein